MSLKNIIVKLIVFYRNNLSHLKLRTCRYYPSCSEYAIEAIEDKGVIIGIYKGVKRLLRCNPFFKGGYDPYKDG